MQGCYRLHTKLRGHKWAKPFMQPVDPVALHIPDYFSIVKNPMDLGTIQKRLVDGSLTTVEEYAELVRLVFDNAILYNKPQDDVAIMAVTLSQLFEREFEQLQRLGSVLESDPSTILTRRRSIKRNAFEMYPATVSGRQYSLRRSGSVELQKKKPCLDLPSDVEPYQYSALEMILSRLQQKNMKTKSWCVCRTKLGSFTLKHCYIILCHRNIVI